MMDEVIRQLRGVVMLRGRENGVPEGMVAVLHSVESHNPSPGFKHGVMVFQLRPDGDRDRINTILQAVVELEKAFGHAQRAEVEAMSNIQGEGFNRLLMKLKQDGNIYEPAMGCYKIV